MTQYPKIRNVFERDRVTNKLIDGAWTLPEFKLLADIPWECSEKIDGTNIRVMQGEFRGKTDSAQIYGPLATRLNDLFPREKFADYFKDNAATTCMYGEGYGAKIQKAGANYRSDVDLILFDIKIGEWWLEREDILKAAEFFGIDAVPTTDTCSLRDAVAIARDGFCSSFGNFTAEGLVCKAALGLKARNGERIVAKIKTVDFRWSTR